MTIRKGRRKWRKARARLCERTTIRLPFRLARAVDHAADQMSEKSGHFWSKNSVMLGLLAHALTELKYIRADSSEASFAFEVLEEMDGESAEPVLDAQPAMPPKRACEQPDEPAVPEPPDQPHARDYDEMDRAFFGYTD